VEQPPPRPTSAKPAASNLARWRHGPETLAFCIPPPHMTDQRRRACAATEAVDPAGCGAIRSETGMPLLFAASTLCVVSALLLPKAFSLLGWRLKP
jgi:hypothetical protein